MKKHSQKKNNIKSQLDKITSRLTLLTGKNGMIKLDSNNPDHVDWWEDDK